MQFAIHAADLLVALKLISSEPEAGEHGHKNQAVPQLQPPTDGIQEHGGRNLPPPTFNAKHLVEGGDILSRSGVEG
jgi:hypothetical protein